MLILSTLKSSTHTPKSKDAQEVALLCVWGLVT